MADLEQETIERAVRWCAEAGRQATPGEVRAALGSLGWDQLLVARALLADPPPARPLGPQALADLARGVPSDVAADREREGRYPRLEAAPPPRPSPAPPPARRARASGSRRPAPVVVRKAADLKAPPPTPATPRLPLVEELLLPAGRATLERLIRIHGGRRPRLVGALAASHRRADGAPLGDVDLDAVLEHHGLDRAFARRERDELVHAVRAAGGVMARAAAALGHQPDGLAAAVTRLGLGADVQRLREARRRDLRARATLAERAQLLVGSADTLADLELLEEIERDLKQRLPEHLRALSSTGEPAELGLARTLGLPGATVRALLARLSVDSRLPAPGPRTMTGTPAPGAAVRPPQPRSAGPHTRTFTKRPAGSRPSGARPPGSRPSGSRPSGSPPSGSRPSGLRPSGSRPSGLRPSGSRPSGSRPPGSRPSASRPPGARPTGPRRPDPGGRRRGPSR